MEVGAEVWAKDRSQGGTQSWIPGIVHSKNISADGKQLIIVVRSDTTGDVKYCVNVNDDNADIDDLKLRNDPSESNVENLINLPYLHEPAILFCLQQRYGKGDIYTYTGPILIAMNPFKRVPLYTPQILEVYYNLGLLKAQGIVTDDGGTPLPPHVYAIADAAYRDMMKVMMHGYGQKDTASSANHSILISGESGAGKTESTKIVLKYLTTVGNSTVGSQLVDGSVMDKVLQSNPILEAFGNAKTIRNDNSSRFGKFIELNFNKRGHLIGGSIKTYLLEKVRLPSQQQGERNFHIFYQLIAGASVEERDRWRLLPAETLHYTSMGQVVKLRNMSDLDEFRDLRTALHTLNFSAEDQRDLFDLVAGCLHLGELVFKSVHSAEGEGSAVLGADITSNDRSGSADSLTAVTALLGVDRQELIKTLTVRTIVARDESYEKKLTPTQAGDARDALAKAIYGRVFDWIVRTINLSIQVSDPAQVKANIGVLDIFGFECFVHNSFEQLCINYTNETLQQQFNQYIFKMEQVEYQTEKIEWSFIEFPDNQDCLDLIENKVSGILAMIDDECRLPSSSDERLASRMYKALDAHSRFVASAPQKRDYKFCVKHYAGSVTYCTLTFVEKNKDEVPREATALLQKSSVSLLAKLFTEMIVFQGSKLTSSLSASSSTSAKRHSVAKPCSSSVNALNSVASQFKEQLSGLMEKIYSTVPHYIRCLKPNDENIPDSFNRLRITEQLRYGGVLEAVRVARSGFPVRLSHLDFFARYRFLAPPDSSAYSQLSAPLPAQVLTHSHTPNYGPEKTPHSIGPGLSGPALRELCELLLDSLWSDGAGEEDTPNKIKRRYSTPFNRIKAADLASWTGRMPIGRESVQLGLSKVFLRKAAHDILEGRRSRRLVSAAKRMQAQFRGHRSRTKYLRIREASRLLQRVIRGTLARFTARRIRQNRCAVRLQSAFRSHLCRRRFHSFRRIVVFLQLRFRTRQSLKKLREATLTAQTINLQRIVRGLRQKKRWQRFRMAVVTLQNRLRKVRARAILRALRIQAKDVGRLQQSNEALKAEIEALKAKAEADNRRMQEELEQQLQEQAEKQKAKELQALRNELEKALSLLETERKLRLEGEIKLRKAEHLRTSMESDLVESEGKLFRSEEALKAAGKKISALEANLAKSRTGPAPSVTSGASQSQQQSFSPSDLAKLQDELKKEQQQGRALQEECKRTALALEKEAASRRLLDDELNRLRQISSECKLQLESLKKGGGAGAASSVDTSSLTAVTASGMGGATPSIVSPIGAVQSQPSLSSTAGPQKTEPPARQLTAAEEEKLAQSGMAARRNRSISEKAAQFESAVQSQQIRFPVQTQGGGQQGKSMLQLQLQAGNGRLVGRNSIGASASNDEGSLSASASASSDQTELSSAMNTFEKNLETFRAKLKLGIKGFYWEGVKVVNTEIVLKLDPSNRLLIFETSQNRRGFSLFQSRVDIAPVSVSDIVECLPGAEIKSEASEQSLLLTVVAKTTDGKESRLLALKLNSRDQRNSVLTGMRTLVADLHINSPTAKALKNITAVPSANGNGNHMNASSVNNGSYSNGSRIIDTAAKAPPPQPPAAPAAASHAPQSQASQPQASSNRVPARRLTKREALIEETLSQSSRGSKAQTDALLQAAASTSENEEKLKMQLSLERANYDRMMAQMIQLSNELNDRDEQISVLKKKESHYEQTLLDRDNMFKQDAMVRMQLGKRLEQVLMDKEEALEQLEAMKEQVEQIRSTLNIAVTSPLK